MIGSPLGILGLFLKRQNDLLLKECIDVLMLTWIVWHWDHGMFGLKGDFLNHAQCRKEKITLNFILVLRPSS